MNKRGSSLGKGIMILLFAIGMIILWFGSCFGIGLVGFSIGFEQSGISSSIGMLVISLAFIASTLLVVWLSVKFSRALKKKKR